MNPISGFIFPNNEQFNYFYQPSLQTSLYPERKNDDYRYGYYRLVLVQSNDQRSSRYTAYSIMTILSETGGSAAAYLGIISFILSYFTESFIRHFKF